MSGDRLMASGRPAYALLRCARSALGLGLLMTAWAAPAAAQNYPLTFSLTTGGSPVYSTAVGEFNGDGILDLVAANSNVNTVSIFLGLGGGGFGPKTDFPTGATPTSVAVGDLNGDGILDLVVANNGAATVSVLLGTGTGSFGARSDFSAGANPRTVALGDMDADGRLDAAVANYGSNTVSVLLGTGTGGFAGKSDYTTGTSPYSVAIGDLNVDGWPDLVVTNTGSWTASVLLGLGRGVFGARTDYSIGGSGQGLAIGDLNGDGKPDVVTAYVSSTSVTVLLGTGTGALGTRYDILLPGNAWSVAIGEFTGDTKPDLVVTASGPNVVSILPGNGNGTFGSRSDFPTGNGPVAVATGDMNQDGKLDLVVGNYYTASVSVLLAAGAGRFGPKTEFPSGINPQMSAAGDLDGDGNLDLAVANFSSNSVSVLLGTGTGGFGPSTDYAAGSRPRSIALGDLNDDDALDMVVANYTSSNVSVWLGTGTGSFGSRTDFAAGSGSHSVAIGDLNGDAIPDLAVANWNAGTVSVLPGTGTGSFGARTDFQAGGNPWCVAIGDLDSALGPDLVVSNSNASSVSVLLNTGPGTFGPATGFGTGMRPEPLRLVDLNNDSSLDIVVESTGSNTVSVLLGTGTGSFGTKIEFPAGGGVYCFSLAVGDLNGDGKLDLAVPAYDTGSVSVLLGTGTGSFGSRSDFQSGGLTCSVAAADLNADGRLDLVATPASGATVSVLLALEATEVLLASTPNPSPAGGAVTLTATVSTLPPVPGPPTGTVNFYDGFTLLGTGPLSGGVATITAFPSALGSHSLTAVYGGTTSLLGRISAPVTQVVRRFYEVVVPNGGEQWTAGTPVTVRWRGKEIADLAISYDGGSAWSTLASGVGGEDENAYALIAPGFATPLARLRVTQTGQAARVDNSDQSDGVFAIVMPTTPPSAAVRLQTAPAGQAANDNFGLAVASAGDFNGDGFADQVVGAYLNDAGGADAGRAYIYFGGPSADAVADVTLTGAAAGDRLGVSVAGVGDVNRDGFADVLVGADRNDAGGTDAGRAYLYLGGASPDNLPDLTLTGGAAGDNFGVAVAGAGDVNDDGYADLLVGASVADGDSVDAGAAYLYLGGPVLDSVADWVVRGEGRADYFGFAVASAGDVNGDRFDDFVVGAYQNSERLYHGGKVYLFLGGRPPDAAPDLEIHGRIAEDFFGVAVAGAGDVDGDGFDDFLAGAQGSDAGGLSSGVAYLFLGGPDIDDTPDVTVVGYAGEQLGRALAGVGDVNGDGFADFATGSRLNDDAGTDAGRVCVYHGGTAPDALPDVVLSGQANLDTFGRSVAGAGDANGDGFADLIVGADRNDFSALNAGRAYLYDFNRYHLLSPVGGENWPVGALRTVHWLGETTADIWLSADGGHTYDRLVDEAGGKAENTVALRVPHLPTRFARIQVRPSDPALTGSDRSDSLFTIEASVALLNFKAEPGEGGTLVSWSTNPTVGPEGLAGYRLYRVPPGGGEDPGVPVGPPLIMESSYRDAGAPAGAGYRLCAVNGLQQELELGRIEATAPFAGMRLWPSPARAGEAIHLVIATPFGPALLQAGLDIAVFDVSGRRVATVPTREPRGGSGRIELDWDGRDNAGQPVTSGVYFVSVRAAAGPIRFRADQRLVVTR